MLDNKTIDKINAEAEKYGFVVPYNGSNKFYNEDKVKGYQAGATEWAGKADGLIEFMEYVINFPPAMSKSAMSEWIDKIRDDARTGLAKYKEVENER
jgi:hypothetical protein